MYAFDTWEGGYLNLLFFRREDFLNSGVFNFQMLIKEEDYDQNGVECIGVTSFNPDLPHTDLLYTLESILGYEQSQ
jgi:hypothetical protein